LAILLAACGAAMPTLPSQGTRWVEATSDHFTLWTDVSTDRARSLVLEMEEHRAIVAHALNHEDANVHCYGFALAGDREARAFLPPSVAAWTIPHSPLQAPLIVFDAYDKDTRDKTFTHELTHVVAHAFIPHQPPWLAEGIATYFESAQPHDGWVEAGLPRADRAIVIKAYGLLPTAELFANNQRDIPRFYATAWLMFTFLVNEHLDELGRYLARLNQLPASAAQQAWTEVFPQLPPGVELDHALHAFLSFGKVSLMHFDAPPVRSDVALRAMTDAEVASVRALARFAHGDKAGALADLATAERAEPTNLVAALVRESADRASLTRDAVAAVANAHPDDWRGWFLLASFDGTARARMCAAAAKDPSAAPPPGACPTPEARSP
jgi:hypothetical protein